MYNPTFGTGINELPASVENDTEHKTKTQINNKINTVEENISKLRPKIEHRINEAKRENIT